MFKTEKQLDYVREKMSGDFEKEFDSAGYKLLAWGDVGWTLLYTNQEIKTMDDLKKTKMWVWTDDPIVKTLFTKLDLNGVQLGVPDVFGKLQTGDIDACYGSPVAAVSLQWFMKVKYASEQPISYAIGAIIITNDSWSKISADDQTAITTLANDLDDAMKAAVRKENKKAKKRMEKEGIVFEKIPDDVLKEIEKQGKDSWDDLVGNLYDQDLLDKVKKYAAEKK